MQGLCRWAQNRQQCDLGGAWHRRCRHDSEAHILPALGTGPISMVIAGAPFFSRLRRRRSSRHGLGCPRRVECRRPLWPRARSFYCARHTASRFGGRRPPLGRMFRSDPLAITRFGPSQHITRTAVRPTVLDLLTGNHIAATPSRPALRSSRAVAVELARGASQQSGHDAIALASGFSM